MPRPTHIASSHRSTRWLIAAFTALLLAACGAPDGGPPRFAGTIVASDFVVGTNRVPFVLTNVDGERLAWVRVHVSFVALDNEAAGVQAEADAVYHEIRGVTPHTHEGGFVHDHDDTRGFYVVPAVELNQAGVWEARFTVTSDPAIADPAPAPLLVRQEPTAPGVGERVPATQNLTLADVAAFAEVSTRNVEADRLHEVSVADALSQGKPLVVVFASPHFCVSAVCGPVVDVVEQVQTAFGTEANFIHIEPWDLVAAREDGRLVPAPVMNEWRLPSEPWVFVTDAGGHVVARFEGAVAGPEIERAILLALLVR